MYKNNVNQSFPKISKGSRNINSLEKLQFKQYSNNLKIKDNNNKDLFSNKKGSNINNLKSSNIFGTNSVKTEYSTKLSDMNLSKIKTDNSSQDYKVNKTIPNNHHRNKKFFVTNFKGKYPQAKTLNNYRAFNTLSNVNIKTESYKNINKFEIDKIISFSNTMFCAKTPQKTKEMLQKRSKTDNRRTKTNKFNSINCFIDDYISKENNEIKKYKIDFKNYFGDSDYKKFVEKEKTYLTEVKKIKLLYKNTNLMKALCDYLNLSLGKIKNERNERIKTIKLENEENKKKKKYWKFLQNNFKNSLIPTKDLYNRDLKNSSKNNFKFLFNNRNTFHLRNIYLSNDKIK
jgi:hypothetical protein